ncbi:hypothetical protein ACFPRL_26685 [Pseudoclavibacter helvolus]
MARSDRGAPSRALAIRELSGRRREFMRGNAIARGVAGGGRLVSDFPRSPLLGPPLAHLSDCS